MTQRGHEVGLWDALFCFWMEDHCVEVYQNEELRLMSFLVNIKYLQSKC